MKKSETNNVIAFWAQRDKYGCFSNFYPCKFTISGITYNCSEQAFMYAKANIFNDKESKDKILNESDPKKIKALGRKVKNFDTDIWNKYKQLIMFNILKQKFSQNEELRAILLSTNDKQIVEDSPYDYIWGIGKDGTGQNLLGKTLMKVRDTLKKSV